MGWDKDKRRKRFQNKKRNRLRDKGEIPRSPKGRYHRAQYDDYGSYSGEEFLTEKAGEVDEE